MICSRLGCRGWQTERTPHLPELPSHRVRPHGPLRDDALLAYDHHEMHPLEVHSLLLPTLAYASTSRLSEGNSVLLRSRMGNRPQRSYPSFLYEKVAAPRNGKRTGASLGVLLMGHDRSSRRLELTDAAASASVLCGRIARLELSTNLRMITAETQLSFFSSGLGRMYSAAHPLLMP